MATFSWSTGVTGDWTVGANWLGDVVPNADDADAVLPGAVASYTVTLPAGATESVNSVTIGDLTFGHVGPTLEVAGTLSFAGPGAQANLFGGSFLIDTTGELEGGAQLPASFSVGTDFNFTNNGTVFADSGSFFLDAPDGFVSNLVNGVLTGGTWIASGFFPPGMSFGAFNWIAFGASPQADIVTDNAVLTINGPLGDIGSGSGAGFHSIAQSLGTIGVSGALNILGGHDYHGSTSLLDSGSITLGGGTFTTTGLSIGATGTLDGFGVVSGGVTNQGAIVADGGALDIAGAIGGIGNLGVASGSTLIVSGATTGNLNDKGTVFAASGLLKVDGLVGGTGSLVVENGATLEFFSGTSQNIGFSGSGATVRLDNFAGYHGTLVGFAKNDTIVLGGAAATSAFVAGSSLVVMNNAATIDTIELAGSYAPGASFSVTNVGTDAIITNLSGAPLQQNFPFDIILNDTVGLAGTLEAAIVQNLSAAAEDWAQYLTGHTTLRIQLNIVANASGSELADAGPTTNIPSGTTLDGLLLDTPSSLIALTTGNHVPSVASDIVVNLPTTSLASLFVNPLPTPAPSGSVPAGQFDLVTVFRHELAHGFGFGGLTSSSGVLGSQETLFDHFITQDVGGTIVFTGPHAEAAYGALLGTGIATPVPLTTLNNGEAFAHFANSVSDPNATDLMSGLGLTPGTQRDISTMDLAVLQDIGAPVTAGGVVCYARGTRIATPRDEVPVEALAIGDLVVTASGRSLPIIWIGRWRVDCRQHPRPEIVLPVRIRANAFAAGLPRRDLLVSPQHGFYLDGVLIPAKCLINGRSIVQQPVRTIEYFHVELPRHDLLLAEGVAAESYLDCGDRTMFDNGGRLVTLHPDFAGRIWDSHGCAELHLSGPVVQSVRRRLDARARSRCAGEKDQCYDLHGGNGAAGDRAAA